MVRALAPALAWGLLCAALGFDVSAAGRLRQDPPTLDSMLEAYRNGRTAALGEALTSSRDFRRLRLAEPRIFERWLGSFDRTKAVMLVEMVEVATRVAPQYARPLLSSGRRYLQKAIAENSADVGTIAFTVTWQRAALGLLQRSVAPTLAEEYARSLITPRGADRPPGPVDPRVLLAFAVAQEQQCWVTRTALERPTALAHDLSTASGTDIDDPGRPSRAALARQDERQTACLTEAVARFTAATDSDETRAEARLRGGWALYQLGKPYEALDWLASVEPGDDAELRYWSALFRGRVLSALGQNEDAATMFRTALGECPGAQSAAIGLAVSLFRLERRDEADELARSLRANPASADPWWTYGQADHRFVDRWIAELREAIR